MASNYEPLQAMEGAKGSKDVLQCKPLLGRLWDQITYIPRDMGRVLKKEKALLNRSRSSPDMVAIYVVVFLSVKAY
jgi:hypothetical protein